MGRNKTILEVNNLACVIREISMLRAEAPLQTPVEKVDTVISTDSYNTKMINQNRNPESSVQIVMPDIEQILEDCIEQMWIEYDVDNSGYLDR